jgi:asparagine synthase (glutamine-hydrolysing)
MTNVLVHRGPDGRSIRLLGNVGLGHLRLSIIDLSVAADQPMSLPDGSLWVTYNGEIHNYLELREELRSRDIQFRTESDTEVVLWAYHVWGKECFERFNGMWSLALWETAHRRLTLSRDRYGIKPLHYSVADDRIAFASEAKAIVVGFPEEADVNWRAAYEFLAGGWPQADDNTFFRNVRSVPPAHSLIFESGRESRHKYWRFEPGAVRVDEAAPQRLLELLDDAVRLRLRSDVPIGICLSGGLDSSTIARLMRRHASAPFECYSLQYADPSIDESHYAGTVADDQRQYRMNWVHPRTEDFVATMEKIVWHYDAPSALRGKYPKWYVMQAAAGHSKVLLEGHGADELLGGYGHFVLPYVLDTLFERPATGGPGRMRSCGRALRQISAVQGRLLPMLLQSAKSLFKQRIAPDGWPWQKLMSNDVRRRYGAPAAERTRNAWFYAKASRAFAGRFDSALWFELVAAGLPESLHAEDATSMAFGIESRAPFLDHRIVEFCFSLPFHQKLRHGWTKWPLREAGAGVIPEAIRWRRGKQGYPGAYVAWMTEPHTLPGLRDIAVHGPAAGSGFFDGRRLRRLGADLRKFGAFVAKHPERAWRIVTFQMWYRRFISRVAVGP